MADQHLILRHHVTRGIPELIIIIKKTKTSVCPLKKEILKNKKAAMKFRLEQLMKLTAIPTFSELKC